jgi:hypothetical protein
MRSMSRKFCAADLKRRLIFSHCNCRRKNLRPFDMRLTCDPSPPLLCSLGLICVTAHNILYCTAEGNMEMVRKRLPFIRWPSPEILIMEQRKLGPWTHGVTKRCRQSWLTNGALG